MLFRLIIAFPLRSKCLLISWLQSPSAVILEPKKIKSVTVSIVFPSICHEVMEPDVIILVFLRVEFQVSFCTLKRELNVFHVVLTTFNTQTSFKTTVYKSFSGILTINYDQLR